MTGATDKQVSLALVEETATPQLSVPEVYQRQINVLAAMVRKVQNQFGAKDAVIQRQGAEIARLKLALGLRDAGADEDLVQQAIAGGDAPSAEVDP